MRAVARSPSAANERYGFTGRCFEPGRVVQRNCPTPHGIGQRDRSHQPIPIPVPTEFSLPLNAPLTVTVIRSLTARW